MAAGTLTANSGPVTAMLASIFDGSAPRSKVAEEFSATTGRIFNAAFATMTWPADLACSQAQYQIKVALQLQAGWDSYNAAPPSEAAAKMATRVVELVRQNFFAAPHIVCSTEGGIAAAFSAEDKFAQIELLNSGNVLTTTYSSRQRPEIKRFKSDDESLSSAIDTLRSFLSR